MASSSETGNAKNVANLNKLNLINAGFGSKYAPSNPLIVLAAMQAQYTDCDMKQSVVNAQNGIFKPLINARKIEFKPVKGIARQVRNYSKSCGAGSEFFGNVNTVVRKLLGSRASKVKATESDPAGTSASQQSYDSTTDNFDKLVELVKNEPKYIPNEVGLKVVTLTAKYGAMKAANDGVAMGAVPFNNAVIARNKALYSIDTGLCDVGQASKDYVRSVFEYSSPEFKMVSKIQFKKMADVE